MHTYAGNEHGFVDGAMSLFKAKTGDGDYHEEMDGIYFEKWFNLTLLPKLAPNTVIVLDNAPYHSVKIEKFPNSGWRVDDIHAWLDSKGVVWDNTMFKVELLKAAKPLCGTTNGYCIDKMAEENGHKVLCLPPYH